MLFLLPLIVCCLIIALLPFFDGYIPKKQGGVNLSLTPITLREKADDSLPAVAYLKPKAFAVIENNHAKRWVYIDHNEKVLAVPRRHFKDGYSKVFNWVLLDEDWKRLVALLLSIQSVMFVAGVLLLIVFLILGIKRKKTIEQTKNTQQEESAPNTINGHNIQPEEPKPYDVLAQQTPATDNSDLYANSLTEKQPTVQALIDDAIEKITKEKDLQYKGQIEEMQAAAETIQEEFNSAQERALLFGLDLTGSHLDNVVKGRLFEVYGAQYWHRHDRLRILDWTPDKGFHHDIDVGSNGNPDFLVEVDVIANKKRIAIEAKYRNTHFFLNPDKAGKRLFCAFEKRYKIERYHRYAIEKGCPVYILLGIGHTADNPEALYLVPIIKVLELEVKDKWERLSMESKAIQRYKIAPEDFYSHFEKITAEK